MESGRSKTRGSGANAHKPKNTVRKNLPVQHLIVAHPTCCGLHHELGEGCSQHISMLASTSIACHPRLQSVPGAPECCPGFFPALMPGMDKNIQTVQMIINQSTYKLKYFCAHDLNPAIKNWLNNQELNFLSMKGTCWVTHFHSDINRLTFTAM